MNSPLFRRYIEAVIQKRTWVILAIAVVTLLLGAQIGSLKIDMSPDIWAPQAHPYVKTTKELEKVFGGRNIAVIGIAPKSGDIYDAKILAKIDRIQHGIEQLPEAVPRNVLSLAAAKVKEIRGTAEGMEVRRMLDPLPRTPQELQRLKAAVAANPIYINALVSPDGKAAAVVADFKMPDNASYAELYKRIEAIVEREHDASVDIYLAGLPVDFAWFEFHMQSMPIYFGLALLIIMGIQYWSFRSLQGMLLPLFTALLSVVWALGVMGLLGVHMDGMNTTTPILIMAVAAGHAIQILKRYYEEYHRLRATLAPDTSDAAVSRQAVVESLSKVGPVMLTAGIIATITFYSLLAAGMSVVRHFGLFAGTGILAALILEMTFIPAVRTLLRPPAAAKQAARTDVLDRLLASLGDQLARGRAPVILVAGLALLGGAILGLTRLQADNSLLRYNAPDSQVRRDDAMLNRQFGGTNTIFFLMQGEQQDSIKDPKVLAAIDHLQGFLARQPNVGKTQSVVDLIKRMHQAMHGDDPRYNVVPDDRALVAQYLFLYSLSGDPQDFDNLVDNDYRKAVVWVYLKDDSTAGADALYQRAQALIGPDLPPGVHLSMGGSLPQSIAINDTLTREKYSNMAQMAVVVFLLASLVLRSVVGGLYVTMPLVLIILANFGLMGWLGAPLDMGTASTASMAIGIGADYEIYLLFRLREELARHGNLADATRAALRTSGKAILFVGLSVAGGYAVLLASGFAFYSRLATMVIATMVISVLSALILQRALVMVFRPRFIVNEQREAALPKACFAAK
jgi:predicted RND superfamily exporter protein